MAESGVVLATESGNLRERARQRPAGSENIQLDLALSRSFAVRAGHRVELRVEMFNFLNLVNLANPVTALSNPNFGRIHVGATGRHRRAWPSANHAVCPTICVLALAPAAGAIHRSGTTDDSTPQGGDMKSRWTALLAVFGLVVDGRIDQRASFDGDVRYPESGDDLRCGEAVRVDESACLRLSRAQERKGELVEWEVEMMSLNHLRVLRVDQ